MPGPFLVAPSLSTDPGCTGPVTITQGGKYSGCWASTNPATPAVTIATTQPVWIDHALIIHAGFGIFAQATVGTNLTVTHSRLLATDPGTPTNQYAIYLLEPGTLLFDHNELTNGHGLLVNGDNLLTLQLKVRFNDYRNIGRWGATELVGAVHFDKILASLTGAEIAWNRVRNQYGRSVCEDVIGIVASNGASGRPIDIHHNLIDGSYPPSGDGAGFTGGGVDLGDVAGSWQLAHHNTILRITNNGLMIPAGTDLEHHSNQVVTSGIADDGTRVSSTFGNGLNLWDNPGYVGIPARVTMHDNTGDHRRWTGSAWERSWQNTPACDPSSGCGNNTNLGLTLTDDAAWRTQIETYLADWEAARALAGVTVGPLR